MAGLTVGAQAAFALAAYEAEQLGSASIDTEHLFLGLCKVEALRDAKPEQFGELAPAAFQVLLQEVANYTASLEAGGLDARQARRRLRALLAPSNPTRETFLGHRTARCRRIFSQAEGLASGTVDLAAFMRAVLIAASPLLDQLLSELKVSREHLSTALQKGATALPRGAQAPAPQATPPPAAPTGAVNPYGRDLTLLAREGKLHPAIGRDDEMKRVARILLQAKKNNPILVGDAGVGKTAIVEGLGPEGSRSAGPPHAA